MLAAGLDGIERGLQPREPNSATLYKMSDAQRSELGNRAAAGQAGSTPSASSSTTTCCRAPGTTRDRGYADYYANVKPREWQAAHEQITQWEMDHYLQLY